MTEQQLHIALENWKKYRQRTDERPYSCWDRDLTEAEMFATRKHVEQVINNPELDWYKAIDHMPSPCPMRVAIRFGCFRYGGMILLQMYNAIQKQNEQA